MLEAWPAGDAQALGASPLVSIGVPTFNRPKGLARTLSCLIRQTYGNLEILVSDNCSSDPRVAQVIQDFSVRDGRIRTFRQQRNLGAEKNFSFVMEHARGEYFMWAADDDTWEREFVERLVRLLQRDERVGLAFCNFDALDPAGCKIETYPDFLPLMRRYARKPVDERLANYITQEENQGKANIVYGLYRRRVLEAAGGLRRWPSETWGADMLIACSVLALADFDVDERTLYHVGPQIERISPLPLVQSGDCRRTVLNRPQRIMSALKRHAGYLSAYRRIVARAPGLRLGKRLRLYRGIFLRFVTLAIRDFRSA